MWLIGNEIWCSTDGAIWAETAASMRWWGERYGHTSLVYNGKMWVIAGGWPDGRDVWSSPDGVNWTVATWAAQFPYRYGHASVVHNGKMWVMGGHDDWGHIYSDVWSSTDGRNWTSATLSAGWRPRYGLTAASFAGTMWVVGGTDGTPYFRDLNGAFWYSADGTNWTSAPIVTWTHLPSFSYTTIAEGALVHGGKLWLFGEHVEAALPPSTVRRVVGEVWSSPDGLNWTQITDRAPWLGRAGMTVVSSNGRMWVIGGASWDYFGYFGLHDVWYSSDGMHWQCATLSAPWTPRWQHSSVVLGGKIWVLGGAEYPDGWGNQQDGYPVNDIWYFATPTAAASWRLYP
jgi:hypothetical protein